MEIKRRGNKCYNECGIRDFSAMIHNFDALITEVCFVPAQSDFCALFVLNVADGALLHARGASVSFMDNGWGDASQKLKDL